MPKVGRVSDYGSEITHSYIFWCPGCEEPHTFRVTPGGYGGHIWTFNNDLDRPTFKPSLLVHHSDGRPRCHLFMTAGQIQYLSDCQHALAGKTVDCPEWDQV